MNKLTSALGAKHKAEREQQLAIWRYRTNRLKTEAIAFGREYRDRYRKKAEAQPSGYTQGINTLGTPDLFEGP